MKTCYFCQGIVERRRIDHMARCGGSFVLVRELPAEVCTQCGETFLDASASRRVDRAIAEAGQAHEHLSVPVVVG